MAHTELLTTWLNDAYGMEQSQIKMLERFAKDFEDYPDIQTMLHEHLEITKRQAEDVKTLLEDLGSSVSSVKSVFGSIMGTVEGMSTSPFKDDVVKDMIMLHAGEHFEHASYLALVSAAMSTGTGNVAEVCERIAKEEKAMADWTEQQMPTIVAAAIDKQKSH